MSKRVNIIARYNENLDWVENLDGDVLIFNKGENYIWPYEVINVENYGREAETYVNAIIHLFETKKINKYDELVFLQGNPTEHYNLLFEALKKELPPIKLLCNTRSHHSTPDFGYIFNNHKVIIDLMMSKIHKNLQMPEIDNLFKLNFDFYCDDGNVLNLGNEVEETIFFSTILGINCKNLNYWWANGAQYFVNKSFITNKKLDWWRELHHLIMYISKDLRSDRIAYTLERIWPLVWLHNN